MINLPASEVLSADCCEAGWCDKGPGVPPDPGDLASSGPAPPLKDIVEEGGLWKKKKVLKI